MKHEHPSSMLEISRVEKIRWISETVVVFGDYSMPSGGLYRIRCERNLDDDTVSTVVLRCDENSGEYELGETMHLPLFESTAKKYFLNTHRDTHMRTIKNYSCEHIKGD